MKPGGSATTVAKYLATLPPERRRVVSAARVLVRRHLPAGYRESMGGDMIRYVIPRSRYPDTYNGQPLCYVALAARKSGCTLHLMSAYADSKQYAALERAFARDGKRMDMGKSCLHFKRLEDLPLAAVAKVIASMPPEDFIAHYEASRPPARRRST